MQTATMTITFGSRRELKPWRECDWTPGKGRKVGKMQAHITYSDGSYYGSVGGPTEQDACLNVSRDAGRWRDAQERTLIDFIIRRFHFYRETQADYSTFACKAAVARDAGVDLGRVSLVLHETYALVA